MRGLIRTPQMAELVLAANLLQSGQLVEPKLLAVYAQWSRLDPRFAEIMVGYIKKFWRRFALGELLEALRLQPWPETMVVLFKFASLGSEEPDLLIISQSLATRFRSRGTDELFFIPLTWPNAVVLRNELTFNAEVYRQSGYVGSQSLVAHARWPDGATYLTRAARENILNDLLQGKAHVTVSDYRSACKNMISVRQAQRDLVVHASPRGFTRNRRYRIKPA